MRSAKRAASLAVAIMALCAGQLHAAGFALKEQSSAAQGNAFAGATAEAGDISYMFFNPAGLTRHDGVQVHLGGSFIAPRIQPQRFEGSTDTMETIGGGLGGSNIAQDAVIQTFYAMAPLGERLRIGMGLNVPFGLETSYSEDWVGRYHTVDSQLETININPAIALRITDTLSVGAGLQIQYLDATLSNAIDFGSIGAALGLPDAEPTQQDGFSELTGDDWALGFTLGALYEPMPGTRFGLGFRSRISHDVTGDTRFELDEAGIGETLRDATGLFTDTAARTSVTLPATLTFGGYHALTPDWAVMAEAQWTRWSELDELRIRFDNPPQDDNVTRFDWDDVWFGAIGVSYSGFRRWKLRGGYAFDQSPAPGATRSPRVPDNDRHWIAIGARYAPSPRLALDAAYTHIFLKDATIELTTDEPGGTLRGNLSGEVESNIHIFTFQATVRF